MSQTDQSDHTADLTEDVQASGYYPALVGDAVSVALAGEPVRAHLLQHEPTFDADELRRHVTVLAITPTRLVVGHTDEHPADEHSPTPYATTSTESIPLGRIRVVAVTRTVPDPAAYSAGTRPDQVAGDVTITVGWGAVHVIDLEPAVCSDPNCEADHGYTGTMGSDDISLRISAAADGPVAVGRALEFARSLSAAQAAAQIPAG